VPLRALLAGSRLGRRLGITPFGVDRAILISGPLALSVAKATKVLGWQPERTSAQVLSDALARGWQGLPLNRER
jgi:nucleoside-diphosphate-sugar epimerase